MNGIVYDTTRDIVEATDGSTEDGIAARSWDAITDAGLNLIGLPESTGGSGGDWQDALATVRAAAISGRAIPLAEAVFGANPVLNRLALPAPSGVPAVVSFAAAVSLRATRTSGGWRLDGTAHRVPFARHASCVVIAATVADVGLLGVCPIAAVQVSRGSNVADEARDGLSFDAVALDETGALEVSVEEVEQMRRLAALARAIQISAAVDETLRLVIRYAGERTQFGRTLSRFQAVAHQIAVVAGEAAIDAAAVESAIRAIGTRGERLAISAAKARTSASATLVAQIAHQVFGALGFTQEHPLHLLTRRLWSWRDEVGTAEHWHGQIGAQVFDGGADGLWPLLTGTGRWAHDQS
jgi:acyl-CoA dehydrogenase